jgi:hypothetical protein
MVMNAAPHAEAILATAEGRRRATRHLTTSTLETAQLIPGFTA